MAHYPEYWEIGKLGYSIIDEIAKKYSLESVEKMSIQTQFAHFLYQLDLIVDKKITNNDKKQLNSSATNTQKID